MTVWYALVSELLHHMGMLGLQKRRISSSICLCSCVLFYIVGDTQTTLFRLLGSGVEVREMVGLSTSCLVVGRSFSIWWSGCLWGVLDEGCMWGLVLIVRSPWQQSMASFIYSSHHHFTHCSLLHLHSWLACSLVAHLPLSPWQHM